MQHNGSYPTLAQLQASWGVLTSKTDVDGTINAASGAYGPYLQQPPKNAIENSSTVAATAAAGVGWVYDASTGGIKFNLAAAKATALGVASVDASTY